MRELREEVKLRSMRLFSSPSLPARGAIQRTRCVVSIPFSITVNCARSAVACLGIFGREKCLVEAGGVGKIVYILPFPL
jgi:hypothetical protein